MPCRYIVADSAFQTMYPHVSVGCRLSQRRLQTGSAAYRPAAPPTGRQVTRIGVATYIIISLDAFTDLCVYYDTGAVYDDTCMSIMTL